jgi:hypothetical protein
MLVASGFLLAVGTATADDRIVSDDPANFTPHVLSGRVLAIAQVGDTMILGGTFSTVQAAADGSPVLNRANLLAFNATTGALSTTFVPNPDGDVYSLIPAGDGTSVYVGGGFNTISGDSAPRLARINVATGRKVPGFTPPAINGKVRTLQVRDNRLWVGGPFTHVGGRPQPALATLDAATGAFDPYMGAQFAGTQNGGTTAVLKVDIDPAGDRAVVIGNFRTLNGVEVRQLAMLDISGPVAVEADWRTQFYAATCSPRNDTYMRDVEFSPDGSYLVAVTTGAAGSPTTACDTAARFESRATGTGVRPTWIATTGGDTTLSVAITDRVVYTGSHARWQNNSFGVDSAGPGAVSRPGIAALDPANGLPYSWNPGRDRGYGATALLATAQGLWVGSDTERIGANEYHARIALMPLEGGKTLRANVTPTLPGRVYTAGTTARPYLLTSRRFDGSTAGTASIAPAGGRPWGRARGAFVINGILYTGWSSGAFTKQSFNGTTYGASGPVNVHHRITPLTAWRDEIAQSTGMFFAGGRIYFTLRGSSRLYYRYFTPESDVVGSLRYVASGRVAGFDPANVRGMFLSGRRLYVGTSNENLVRVAWSGTGPVAGTATVVSGPRVDGQAWSARATFLR